MTADRVIRELWWAIQDFFPVGIIPTWFFIYHMANEQDLFVA
jgi:hypothetical protein